MTKIDSNTINRISQLLRAKILRLAEGESYFDAKRFEANEDEVPEVRHEEAWRQGLHADSEQLLSE